MGVGRLAKSMNVPVIVLAGTVGPGAEQLLNEGILEFHSIKPKSISLPESLINRGLGRLGRKGRLPLGMLIRENFFLTKLSCNLETE